MMQDLKKKAKYAMQRFFTLCARDVDITLDWEPVLVIAPHPDDESLGCGAVIARLRAAGQRVRIVIVTDGAAAGRSASITPEQIAACRRKEAENAGQILGVPPEDIVFLQFPDGCAAAHAEAIENALAQQIMAVSPRRIFAPYSVDRHQDHRAVAAAVDHLCRTGVITCPVYEYLVWFWSCLALGHMLQPRKLGRLLRISTRDFLASKKAAIDAHRSQHEKPEGETDWFTFAPGFLELFLMPFELFFEKSR